MASHLKEEVLTAFWKSSGLFCGLASFQHLTKEPSVKLVFVELEENLSPLDIKPIMSFPSLSLSHASRLTWSFFPQLANLPIGQKNVFTNLSQQIPEAQIGAENKYYTWVQHYAKKSKSHLPWYPRLLWNILAFQTWELQTWPSHQPWTAIYQDEEPRVTSEAWVGGERWHTGNLCFLIMWNAKRQTKRDWKPLVGNQFWCLLPHSKIKEL